MSNSASFNPFANIEHLSSDIPSILAASCKKVFKKDVATRLKGLYEIFNWIKASDSIDVFRDDFLKIYLQLSIDPDRQIRELVQQLLRQIAETHRSFLKPIGKKIGPKWLGSTFDPVPSVAEASLSSFTTVFKNEKVPAFCTMIETELVMEVHSTCSGSLEFLEARLKLLGEDSGNIEYSCDLYMHYLIRAVLFVSSKLDRPLHELADLDLKLITLTSLKRLRGDCNLFLRHTYYRFLSACCTSLIPGKFFGRLDDLTELLCIEQDGASLAALLSLLEMLIDSSTIDKSKFQPVIFAFCTKLISVCDPKISAILLRILAKHYLPNDALDSLEINFTNRSFIETNHVKSFVELYVAFLSNCEIEDFGQRRERLYDTVFEERLPFSSVSISYYLDLFLRTWNDDDFTNQVVKSLAKRPCPSKLLLKLPLVNLWNNEKVRELCLEIISSSSIVEASKIIALIKNATTVDALSKRFLNLNLIDQEAILILNLSVKESIPEIMTLAADQFECMSPYEQEDLLLTIDHSVWPLLFKSKHDFTCLQEHLLGKNTKLALQLSATETIPICVNLQEFVRDFNTYGYSLDGDDCAALMHVFECHNDFSNLKSLISLAYDHNQTLLFPALNQLMNLIDDEDLLFELVNFCFLKPEVFSLLARAKNVPMIVDFVARIVIGSHHELHVNAFASSAKFVLDHMSHLSVWNTSNFLATAILEVCARLDSDQRVAILNPSARIALLGLNELISICLCSDANFNDQVIEMWITQKFDGPGLVPSVLQEIPVSVANLLSISSLIHCTPSRQFIEMFRLDRSVPSSDMGMVAAVYVIMCSECIDSSKILESFPEDIDENAMVILTRVLSEEIVCKTLSIRSDLFSYVLERFKGDSALKLKFIANNCHFGRINIGFWDHWSSHLTESLDFGLRHFKRTNDLEVLKWVVLVAFHYLAQESKPLSPYYSQLYNIWAKFGSAHKPCGIVQEITKLLSMVSRHHIASSFKTVNSNDMLQTFCESANVHDLLVVRFFMVLKIDEILESLQVEVANQSGVTKLLPISNISSLYHEETNPMKKLLLVDMFMSYLEGAADVSGLACLYNEAFQEISNEVIGLCLEVLGWSTKTPFDLNKCEFVVIDSEEVLCSDGPHSFYIYTANLFARIVKSIPSAIRAYHSSRTKETRVLFERYFANFISPIMTAREISRLKRYEKSNPSDALRVKVFQTSTNCGVHAQYSLEDLCVELSLQIPSSFPLEPIAVSGGKRLGISEAKWRSWILSCQTVFKSDSISILDGLLHWKSNVEKSLDGMEPCPICYCIFHASDKTLPGPSCKTCSNKYHPSCLYKWFKSSGNATCPMCRSVF